MNLVLKLPLQKNSEEILAFSTTSDSRRLESINSL